MSHARDLLTLAALVFVVTASRAALADEPAKPSSPASLQSAFDEAQKLAGDPATRDEAMARLEALVAAHRANAALYDASLEQLAEHYRSTGRAAEGLRFFVNLALQDQSDKRADTLRGIIADYQLRDPKLFEQVLVEEGHIDRGRKPALRPPSNEELVRAIVQRDDADLRDRTLATLREQLAADQPAAQQLRALVVLNSAISAKFEREPFRELVLPLVEAENPQVRMMALWCISGLSTHLDDLQRIAPLADDPSKYVRSAVASTLVSIGKGKARDVVIPALKRLLADNDPEVVRATIRAQWGQYPDAELDERLIALADSPRDHHEAIYFGLSPQRDKSPAVCRRLVAELADPDWNNSGRAAWGLTFGVPDDARPLVEEGLLKALSQETNAYTRDQEFKALAKVVSEKSREYLSQVAANESETDAARDAARTILGNLDAEK